MTNHTNVTKPLATAVGLLCLIGSAFAQSGSAENKIRDRADGARPDFVDVGSKLRLAGAGSEGQFRFTPSLTFAAGYATNPDQLSAQSGSFFLGSTVDLDLERVDSRTNSVFTAGYEAAGTFFEHDHDSNDEIDQQVYAAWQREFVPGVQGRLTLSDTDVTLDYDSLLNVAALSGEVRKVFSDVYSGGLAYTYQNREARLPVLIPRRDPDAVRHIPSVYFTTDLAKLAGQADLPLVTVAYSRYWNLADGNDEDFAANRVSFRATNWKLGSDFSADLEAAYEDRTGSNLNSRLGGLAVREDELTRVALVLRHPMLSLARTQLAFQTAYEHSHSNVAGTEYHGWTFALTGSRSF